MAGKKKAARNARAPRAVKAPQYPRGAIGSCEAIFDILSAISRNTNGLNISRVRDRTLLVEHGPDTFVEIVFFDASGERC